MGYSPEVDACPAPGSAGVTILAHLHGGHLRRSTSLSSAKQPSKSLSFNSIEDLEDQMRLVTMVTAFAQKAVKGCTCTLVEEATGMLVPAKYSLDRELLQFSVVTRREASNEVYIRIRCPIVAIECIYTFADSSTDVFQEQVMALKTVEKHRVLKLRYRNSSGIMANLTILEESPSSVESTSQSLRILCMSAKGTGYQSTSSALCVSARRA